ncbi:hypothetical protein [Hydrogenophaga intermedia]|uniref:hypothetical protein n=1 Tax=Hydrogenophaga intermedia TaxID=65786 RepID=UPI0020430E10|nr:hypothetical protein [Hydrogenophaga intermedia]MCM3562711.1 hypothetical protein [Hydrogenophaga intermedia]
MFETVLIAIRRTTQREALYRHALAVARAIVYDSTGTAGFVHDAIWRRYVGTD